MSKFGIMIRIFAVFLGGYFIGFYEYKYKVMKFLLELSYEEGEEEKGSQK